jgi:hypothetical protein
MAELLDMMATYTTDVTNPPDFSGLELTTFYNSYPKFEDTNNLSLVTFIDYRDIHIVFPGDLEKLGWQNLLQGQSSENALAELICLLPHIMTREWILRRRFNCCQPELVIISDESIQYGTQKRISTTLSRHILEKWPSLCSDDASDGMITISQRMEKVRG